ncbi:related to hsp70 protein [Claviceps purpurea 20.1]|uniref:Related to hsp70 protein n=1 Tax=Claviceps purpurea (strain 20.1) TaxID=1111077 RepID=M1W8T9_CLAP2|nr:related to hsp70 protein [Claviceps purpurea 20.1]
MTSHAGSNRLFAARERDEKLIIALDFGTTYSGVAYCFANQTNAVPKAVLDWPDQGLSAPKIPTIIEYTEKDSRGFRWGASVDRLNGGIVGIKLLLDPTQERPLYLPTKNIDQELKSLPKKPFEVAADFIQAIYEHALQDIGKTIPKAYMDMCDKEFVLSVPAVWSDAAKNATLKAAELAGIKPVTIVKEPEAAALYAIKSLDFAIERNDAFVVCDAGGGTVDLISYEVVGITPRLKVKELVPGTGGMAGSLGLNQRFATAVEELVGDDQWPKLKASKAWSFAEKQFDEEVKRKFNGGLKEVYYVNFPLARLKDNEDHGLASNTWAISGKVLSRIFEPLIADILKMIEHQVQEVRLKRPGKGVSGIFLVGGFGSSNYLMQRVKDHFPKIQVLQPSDAWAAIVKGAVLSKLPSQVAVVKTGETILRDQRFEMMLEFHFENIYNTVDFIRNYDLWQCEDKDAPIHPGKATKIKRNCNVTADLRSVPKDKFARKIDKTGKSYYALNINLVMTFKSAVMTFSMEVDGEEMGSTEVDYA